MDKGNKKRKPRKRDVFIAYDEIRNKYNTEEVMKELSVGKSSSSRLLDLIANYKKGD